MICPLWNFEDVNLSGKWNCWLIREPWHLLSSTFVSFPDEKFIPDQYFLGTKWIDHSNNLLPRVVESDSLGRSLFSISKSFPDPLSKIWNFSAILNLKQKRKLRMKELLPKFILIFLQSSKKSKHSLFQYVKEVVVWLIPLLGKNLRNCHLFKMLKNYSRRGNIWEHIRHQKGKK